MMNSPTCWIEVPEGMTFEYRLTQRQGRPNHLWALHNELGAIHISAWHDSMPDYGRLWIGGIECHFAFAPEYMAGQAPSHERCYLLDAPCWHDGSSLYFQDYIADDLPREGHQMDEAVHRRMLGTLIRWHREKIVAQHDSLAEVAAQGPAS